MFKKFKDKLAEEVKSSPQRIQQFAQAAQAAVTSASSSISDITNNDLFSIGGDETPTQASPAHPSGALSAARSPVNNFHDVSLNQTPSPYAMQNQGVTPNDDQHQDSVLALGGPAQRLRKLSNSSVASDVSFRLPSYDSPSMYHLQSDMEVTESEAESVAGGSASLERVTKEQVYAAYRRTQDRYNKYRARYADLAKHYKTLERENAKARAVLVETQDKALRRISELREQCALEQSAKAHLENALRVELDERNMKIEALNTKIQLMSSYNGDIIKEENAVAATNQKFESKPDETSQPNLIDLGDAEKTRDQEITVLNNKIQKMEQLSAKYKESLKALKEMNSQLTTEIRIISTELDMKSKENEQLQVAVKQLTDARQQIQELKESNHELQTKVDNFEKIKDGVVAAIQIELEKAKADIQDLNRQIYIFTKREEENAISLAENKLSIHKELESKEAEIKQLTNKLKSAANEIKSYELVADELKQSLKNLEGEKASLNIKLHEMQSARKDLTDLEIKLEDLQKHVQSQEQINSKLSEELKCVELELKQETAEKLAMIDRNNYLENRNRQLTEDNSKKNKQIADLEKEILQKNSNELEEICDSMRKERDVAVDEMHVWRSKYNTLELEIKDERVELVKLQTEIDKLLTNYEKLQVENIELNSNVSQLQNELKLVIAEKDLSQKQFLVSKGELEEKLKGLENQLTETASNVVSMEKEIRQCALLEAEEKYKILEAEIKQSYESQIAELRSQEMASSEYTIAEELSELKKQFEYISKQKHDLETRLQQSDQNSTDNDKFIRKIHELEANISNYDTLKIECETLVSERDELKTKLQRLENDIENLKIESERNIKDVSDLKEEKLSSNIIELENITANFDNLKLEYDRLVVERNELKEKVQCLQNENENLKSKADQIIEDVASLQVELTEVKKSHDRIENEKDNLVTKISRMEQKELNKNEDERRLYNETINKNEEMKKNLEKLKEELESLMAEKHKLHNDLLASQYDVKEKEEEIIKYKESSCVWEQKLAKILEENNSLHEKCEKLKQDKENAHETMIKLEQKATEYEKKLKEQEESSIEKEFLDLRTNQLENDLKFATLEKDKILHENQLLKVQLSDLDKSHVAKQKELEQDVEKEKSEKEQITNKLKDIVRKLEEQNIDNEKKSETISELEKSIDELNIKLSSQFVEVDKLKTSHSELDKCKLEKEQLIEKFSELSRVEQEYKLLKRDYEIQKEEKSKLVADIEGLQVHLSKVSKDNSQLNDRIREMITIDENLLNDNKDEVPAKLLSEINELKDSIKIQRDLVEDLERQNSILVEEKLELEDQLKSRHNEEVANNHVRESTEKELEITRLREKNYELLDLKAQLESKLADMELVGRSGDRNLQNLEQKNEKLRLKNDKLERRLDEALVSLRHLRALEENTELEYLRNILYEYLTGTGAHSLTLAKVLAAVVKFDDRQTQLVLQREKERQGLLGQLGLL